MAPPGGGLRSLDLRTDMLSFASLEVVMSCDVDVKSVSKYEFSMFFAVLVL